MSIAFEQSAEQLSALADGELDSVEVAKACALWRVGDVSHTTWHAYHLIGDVLRSEDLAGSPARDQTALRRLREQLAKEPVVLAPQREAAGVPALGRVQRRVLPWGAVSAVAAGFAVVAGAVFVLRGPIAELGAPSATLARAGSAPSLLSPFNEAAPQAGVANAPALLADGKLVRDARLDRYLDAHKHFSGTSALGVPSSFLRAATSDATNR